MMQQTGTFLFISGYYSPPVCAHFDPLAGTANMETTLFYNARTTEEERQSEVDGITQSLQSAAPGSATYHVRQSAVACECILFKNVCAYTSQ